jgi:hypothetical protein
MVLKMNFWRALIYDCWAISSECDRFEVRYVQAAMIGLSLRTICNLVGVALYFAVASCTSLPQTFTRVDGRFLDPKQLPIDQATCREEIKDNLSTKNEATIWGSTEDEITIYSECMARHGYRVVK